MNHDLLQKNLEAAGWKVFPCWKTYTTALYKPFYDRAECRCNEGKKKQAEIYLNAFPNHSGEIHESVTIEVHGELDDGSWIRITLDSLDLRQDAEYYEAKANFALDVWDFSTAHK